jgi:hypothetical protein
MSNGVTSTDGVAHVSTENLRGDLEDARVETVVDRIGGEVLLSVEATAGGTHAAAGANLDPAQARGLAERLAAAADAAEQERGDE